MFTCCMFSLFLFLRKCWKHCCLKAHMRTCDVLTFCHKCDITKFTKKKKTSDVTNIIYNSIFLLFTIIMKICGLIERKHLFCVNSAHIGEILGERINKNTLYVPSTYSPLLARINHSSLIYLLWNIRKAAFLRESSME